MIAEAALQEDADVVGLSILSGAHLELFPHVLDACAERDILPANTLFFCGGIIPEEDVARLQAIGFQGVFGPGANTNDIIDFVRERVPAPA